MHTSLNCKLNLKVLNQAFGLKNFLLCDYRTVGCFSLNLCHHCQHVRFGISLLSSMTIKLLFRL